MGKLGKKARKFARKNLQSVLKRKRKLKSMFKKKASKKEPDEAENQEEQREQSKGRNVDCEGIEDASLDELFSDDSDAVGDDSESDGYLSEGSGCTDMDENESESILEDGNSGGDLSIQNKEIHLEITEKVKRLDRLKKKDPAFLKFLEIYENSLKQLRNEENYFDEDDANNKATSHVMLSRPTNNILQIAVHLWATGEGIPASHSFDIIKEVASAFSSDCFETCLVKTYKTFIGHCKFIDPVSSKYLQFLQDTFVELCSQDVHKSCSKAIISVQQLARISQVGLQTKKKEVVKKICSWQYINCVDLWVSFISANSEEYDLQQLLYMLPKHWLKSQSFQQECVYSTIELLAMHFAQWSYHMSFPELATIPLICLRKFHENFCGEF